MKTTSISNEAQKSWMGIWKKFTLEQCHTIKIKKSLKWRNLKNLGIKLALQLIDKLDVNM